MTIRPRKLIRLNYWKDKPELAAMIAIMGDPAEVRMAASPKSFVSVHEEGITLSGGFPSKIQVQGLSNSFVFAGMVQNLPFPLTLIPSTVASPMPQQVMKPPLAAILPMIKQFAEFGAMISSMLPGVP